MKLAATLVALAAIGASNTPAGFVLRAIPAAMCEGAGFASDKAAHGFALNAHFIELPEPWSAGPWSAGP